MKKKAKRPPSLAERVRLLEEGRTSDRAVRSEIVRAISELRNLMGKTREEVDAAFARGTAFRDEIRKRCDNNSAALDSWVATIDEIKAVVAHQGELIKDQDEKLQGMMKMWEDVTVKCDSMLLFARTLQGDFLNINRALTDDGHKCMARIAEAEAAITELIARIEKLEADHNHPPVIPTAPDGRSPNDRPNLRMVDSSVLERALRLARGAAKVAYERIEDILNQMKNKD